MDTILDHRPRPYTIVEDILFECDLSSLQKLTLITLIKYAGKQSSAWPGLQTLARNTSSSARQLRRILHDLHKSGLLKIERRPGQSSLYHIPEYQISDGHLVGIWKENSVKLSRAMVSEVEISTPDTMALPPGHHDLSDRTQCQDTPDIMSPKQSQEHSQGKTLSQVQSPSRSSAQNHDTEKDYLDQDLIKAWCQQFSIKHHPASSRELNAMDWMLYAAGNKNLRPLTSPIGYLKTITKKGFPTDFPSYSERQHKSTLPSQLDISIEHQWNNLNPVHRKLFQEEAKDQGVDKDNLDAAAFKIFVASLVHNHKPSSPPPFAEPPIKSPPTPHIEPC